MKISGHIFLTGFMGSGKTTTGKKLARLLNLPFIDLDQAIETQQQRPIRKIFEDVGEQTFRKIEKKMLANVAEKNDPCVIALGGGTVCDAENLQLIKSRGLLIYLELSAKALVSRLQANRANRPLLNSSADRSLEDIVTEKLQSRKNAYEAAHITVNGVNLSAQALYHIIVEQTRQHTNDL